ASLAGLSKLREAYIGDFDFTPAQFTLRGVGWAHLKNCKEITSLTLHGRRMGDGGLIGIKDWKHLVRLRLAVDTTDRGLAQLKGLEKLEDISFQECRLIKGDGLIHLKDLPKLSKVDLSRSAVTDQGMKAIRELKQIEELHLMHTKISD